MTQVMTGEQLRATLRRLKRGDSQRSIAADLGVNPVTVGALAKRHGITYPKAQKSAQSRRGQVLRQPEKSFQTQVIELATLHHWWVKHNPVELRSTPGWPDLVLARAPVFLLAELKADDGSLMPHQARLHELLRACGVRVEVWRPRDWTYIEEVLA